MMNTAKNNQNIRKGTLACIGCSILWGVLPVYWKSLIPIPSEVIIVYRVILVALVTFIFSLKLYGINEIKQVLYDKRTLVNTAISGLLITFNWSLYIWAVNANHVIQTCIGYYIEPLVVCIFGLVLFKEKLEKHISIALLFAIAGLVVILIHFRQFPSIALGLSVSFAIYAALKKNNRLKPLLSLFYETVFLLPFGIGIVLYLELSGKGALSYAEPYQYLLLLLCGLFTAIPLGLFAYGANNCTLITVGIIEYLSPSLTLILGIFVFKEAFDYVQFIAFLIIWIGLIVFTVGGLRNK